MQWGKEGQEVSITAPLRGTSGSKRCSISRSGSTRCSIKGSKSNRHMSGSFTRRRDDTTDGKANDRNNVVIRQQRREDVQQL